MLKRMKEKGDTRYDIYIYIYVPCVACVSIIHSANEQLDRKSSLEMNQSSINVNEDKTPT